MTENKQFAGVIAALLLPRSPEGQPDWTAFERNARFALHAGAIGLCVNGATGEFAGALPVERRTAVTVARKVAGSSALVLSGVGGTRWCEIVTLAEESSVAGADALLVPAPHFFTYSQDDLNAFYRALAGETRVPLLLYNLPAFTGSLDLDLAAELIQNVDGIVGVKDSSGQLDLLESLTRKQAGTALRLVGNDAVAAEALQRELCDGIISGVAGVLPELTVALWKTARDNRDELFGHLSARLDALLAALDIFPTPWGLKLIAELRGLGPASIGLPLSAQRAAHVTRFVTWFPKWWSDTEGDLVEALRSPLSLCALDSISR